MQSADTCDLSISIDGCHANHLVGMYRRVEPFDWRIVLYGYNSMVTC